MNFISSFFFFFNDTATTEIYTLSLHDALPIYIPIACRSDFAYPTPESVKGFLVLVFLEICHSQKIEKGHRSEEHTSELQSRQYLVCRLLLEKKKKNIRKWMKI